MAIPCQGFTFSFGGNALAEVQTLEMDVRLTDGGAVRGRSGLWSGDGSGEVRLASFSPAAMSRSVYGTYGRLLITAPAPTGTLTVFDGICLYKGMAVRAATNDAILFAYSFSVYSVSNSLSIA